MNIRITATVVGLSARKNGVSKAGNPYDFYELSVLFPKDGINGKYAQTFIIDTPVMENRTFNPGDIVELFGYEVKYRPHINYIIHHPQK